MIAPLIAVAMALLSKKLQDDQQKKKFTHDSMMAQQEANMEIDARRAARAGDSGYMQAAGRAAIGFPRAQPSQAGPTLLGVGQALAAQRDAPSTTGGGAGAGEQESSANNTAPQLRGTEYDEDENKRNYFGSFA